MSTEVREGLFYTKQHEWVRLHGDIATVGITAYAAESLGDIVFVELPDIGVEVSKDDAVATVESVKAASDVYSPVSGEIIEVNMDLDQEPEKVNHEPYGEGWFFKVKVDPENALTGLMDSSAYQDYINSL